MEWWGTFLISIASAVVSGIMAGLFTVYIERRKQKREDMKKIEEIHEKANEKKPRLEINNYAGIGVADKLPVLRKEKPFTLLALYILDFKDNNGKPTFIYDDGALNKNNYVCVEYYFINSGLTEIKEICFTSNIPKTMALFDLNNDMQLVKNQMLNYEAWHDQRYIKPNDRIVVRIYYVKNMIPKTTFASPEIIIWLKSVDGYIWRQSLYSPLEQIEYPVMSNEKEFKEARDISKAIDCFRDPSLW